MGTTAQKLNKILETKEAIRTAINNKGGTLTETDSFASYSAIIANLETTGESATKLKTLLDTTKSAYYLFYGYKGASVDNLIAYSDTSNVTNMQNMFDSCNKLTTIPQLDTSSSTNMSYTFQGCRELTTIPQLNTSNVASMRNMFSGDNNLISVPQLDTSNVTDMASMFAYCFKLTTIPQLNTSKCTNMNKMFNECNKLTTIDITHMNITSTSNTNSFAYGCCSLTKLIIRNMDTIPLLNSNAFTNCFHFTGTVHSACNPSGLKDGRIYVPDNKVEELKIATNWSVYADIIVPLSTLVE